MSRPPLRALLLVALSLFLLSGRLAQAQGTPLGFEEEFALATDRQAILERLIPGTEDYYFYRCLERQHAGAFDEVEPLLKLWIGRHGRGARVIEIENRQALLTFERNPAATFGFLKDRLGLSFDHQPVIGGRKPDLPTRLDARLIAWDTLRRRALGQSSSDLRGFADSALERLLGPGLSERHLTALLERLDRPDQADLPALVVKDLERQRSAGFGSLDIHGQLLLAQLEECARLRPSLLTDGKFVAAYLWRLRPNPDVDWRHDAAAREAYLDRLEAFAGRLGTAFDSLEAHVLHHRLVHDLALGQPDEGRFQRYLRLPRQASYAKAEYLRDKRRTGELVNLAQEFATEFPRVENDEPLVRAYFEHFFRTADSPTAYAEFVDDRYLRRVFAETKILAGTGDMERWYSMLDDPGYYEALKERVEIEFAPTQRRDYGATEPVAIAVELKNVDTLLVKVFEINALNYYVAEGREVDASINLDGLIANEETTYTYDDSPLRRVRREFSFASLTRPGVYVVEFIGNGLSSRAIVRKGHLQYLERQGAAGHVLLVLDEEGVPQKDASVRIEGREFTADEEGEILVPYSTDPGNKPIILRGGALTTLDEFTHAEERYTLEAGALVDRESLLAGARAQILVRPELRLNRRPLDPALLEDAVLSIESTDKDGVTSTLEVRDLALGTDGELVHEIQVPKGLARLRVSLRGHLQSLSVGEPVALDCVAGDFVLNGIDRTPDTAAPLLRRTAGGYFLDILGKTGEPLAEQGMLLALGHRDFTDPVEVALKTDAAGRIDLGPLPDIERVTVLRPTGTSAAWGNSAGASWTLDTADRSYPRWIHGVAGEVLRVPYQGRATKATRAVVSLLETYGGYFVTDYFDHVALVDGFLELRGLPAGDYSLLLEEAKASIEVVITAGPERNGWALGRNRMLETAGRSSLHITGMRIEGDELVVHCANADEDARVHVFGSRYVMPSRPRQMLGTPAHVAPAELAAQHAESSYHSGRTIGEEYRYILERRFARKYAGNMLRRPSLLLNPWSIEDTDSGIGLGGGAGGKFGGRAGGSRNLRAAGGSGSERDYQSRGTTPNLDFLPAPAPLLANRKPDAKGTVRIPLAELGPGQEIHVLAVDGWDTVHASLALPAQELAPRDLRLAAALPVDRHYAEQRAVEFVATGARAELADVTTSEVERFESLADVFQLYQALSGNPDLAKFAFLLRWPELDEAEKRALYSEHACHELHFFVYRKDPGFFAKVVRPYLANKADRTFLDRWLLAEDLTRYLDPWAFARLNIVERILLSRRVAGEGEAGARHVRELWELVPTDATQLGFLFNAALKSGALEVRDDALALARSAAREPARRGAPPGGPSTPGPGGPATGGGGGGPGAPAPADKAGAGREKKLEEGLVLEEELEELADFEEDAKQTETAKRKQDANKDRTRREFGAGIYRAPEATERYAEHNYWHRRIQEQDADLIDVNAFWLDFARYDGKGPFCSTHFAEASGNIAEMILALAVLDLPFTAGEHTVTTDGKALRLTAATPLLLVKKELEETLPAATPDPLLITQGIFRLDDRYVYEGNERREKYVRDEFLTGVAYGGHVVVTNPTASPRRLELLLQIPEGALPVNNGFETRGLPLFIDPYGTASFEYGFYFPAPGRFPHYPVHAAEGGALVAYAPARGLNVVRVPSTVDTTSWEHVSQSGTAQEVLAFLAVGNLHRIDLDRIAWRMRDADFFREVLAHVRGRHAYANLLWSYGVHHGDVQATREYLAHATDFLGRCGAYLESPLLAIDPIERRTYEHIEYYPLFNGRAHRFGKRWEILNGSLAHQYQALLDILAYRPTLGDADWLSVTYYLLLQDRVEEALACFARVDPQQLVTRVQYDYMHAYMDFFSDDRAEARGIATRYLDHPVPRWRALFQEVVNQLDEAEGKTVAKSDAEDRTQVQSELADREPALELLVQDRRLEIEYANLAQCDVNYYEMDIEFLFSTSPFVQQGSGSFAYIRPNRTDHLELPLDRKQVDIELPAEFKSSNVLVEVRGGGVLRRQAYYANSLTVQVIENYGQLKVTHAGTGKPLAKVYVKVFARKSDGGVRFHKDGYTDLRGRFDYASLSGTGGADAERYAILVLSEEDGAVIREVAPPVR